MKAASVTATAISQGLNDGFQSAMDPAAPPPVPPWFLLPSFPPRPWATAALIAR